jgi:hypothetical protein
MKALMVGIAAVSLVCAFCWCGCTILAPQVDESHFFMLAPLPRAVGLQDAPASDALPNTIVGLGPITLPPYLDRDELVIRLTPTQVAYSPIERWAEPLNVNVARVLLQNLSLLLEADHIVIYPWPNTSNVQYQIEVEFVRFDVVKSGDTELDARYAILQAGIRAPLVIRKASFSRPGAADASAAAIAMSAVLGDLSQDIAAATRALLPPQVAPQAAPRNPDRL